MRTRFSVTAVACCVALSVSGLAQAAPADSSRQTRTLESPAKFGTSNETNLGRVTGKDMTPAQVERYWAERWEAAGANQPLNEGGSAFREAASPPVSVILVATDPDLPPSDLFKPILPDLSGDTVPGRAVKAGRLVLGAVGFGILGYGLYRFFLLAAEALTGKRGIKSIVEQLIVYLVAFSVLFMLLGGSMYQFLKAIFEFAHTSV